MSTYEIIAISISIVALAATLINIFIYCRLTSKYHQLVSEQNMVAQGQAETSMRALIMNARRNVESSSEKVIGKKDDTQVYEKMFNSAQEDLRNAYEEACSRYLDGKIDKKRFKRMYSTEIRQLVEDKEQKAYYNDIASRYECTRKVYDEWFHLEK